MEETTRQRLMRYVQDHKVCCNTETTASHLISMIEKDEQELAEKDAQIAELQKENERYRDALKYYAGFGLECDCVIDGVKTKYQINDIARQALKKD